MSNHRYQVNKNSPFYVKDPLTLKNAREKFCINVFCRFGRHSWKRNQVHKFNGGNTCWLCRNCRVILRYDSEETFGGKVEVGFSAQSA